MDACVILCTIAPDVVLVCVECDTVLEYSSQWNNRAYGSTDRCLSVGHQAAPHWLVFYEISVSSRGSMGFMNP